jgi:cobalt/nickel transport system ATP-binding protein
MAHPALSVEDLHFTYPDGTIALEGIGFTVASGERVALIGPNGAGKTTLGLHLNGIHRPERGSVRVHGISVGADTLREVRRRVQLVTADSNDQLFMPTVEEDVAFGPANLGLRDDELAARVDRALADVGATALADRVPHHLSTGEKRRAALATVLAMDPDVLVLDEPSAGLDPRGRRELIELLDRLPQTQVVITHDLPLVAQHCPRSIVIDGGRVVADGPTAEILGDDELLRAHHLELPYRFDPSTLT